MLYEKTPFDAIFGKGRGSGVVAAATFDDENRFWSKGGFDAPIEIMTELAKSMSPETLIALLAQASTQEHGKTLVEAIVAARMTDDIVSQRVKEVWDICFSDDFDLPSLVESAIVDARAASEVALWQQCRNGTVKPNTLEHIGEESVVGRTSKAIAKYILGNEDEVAFHITGDADWTMSFAYWEQFVRVCTTLTDKRLKQYFRDNARKFTASKSSSSLAALKTHIDSL